MSKTKIDPGKASYEKDVASTGGVYKATGRPRPPWDQLSELAKDAWRWKAKHDA